MTEEPEPAGVTEEDATAEATDVEPADEGTDETEAIEEQPPAEEPAEEQEVHPHEQLAPTAVVEHEVEVPDHEKHEEQDEKAEEPSEDEKPGEPDNEDEEPAEDEENTETRLMPLIPEPTFTDFEEFTAAWKAREVPKPEKKPESTTAWPEPDDAEAATATRLIPVIKDEEPTPRPSGGSDDLSALTDTGSFARLIATGPAPEVPSFAAPLDIPETEYLAPTTPALSRHDAPRPTRPSPTSRGSPRRSPSPSRPRPRHERPADRRNRGRRGSRHRRALRSGTGCGAARQRGAHHHPTVQHDEGTQRCPAQSPRTEGAAALDQP